MRTILPWAIFLVLVAATSHAAPLTTQPNAVGMVVTNSLGADVNLNNADSYFDGPTVAQGASGTWFASGGVALLDTSSANYTCKLWDGATVVEAQSISAAANTQTFIHLSGTFTSPAGNIKISCNDTRTTGKILHTNAGVSGAGAFLSAFRIQ